MWSLFTGSAGMRVLEGESPEGLLPVDEAPKIAAGRSYNIAVTMMPGWKADGEMRYHAIGHTASGPLLLTVFVDRSADDREVIRIISAREAEKYEQRAYARQFEEGY